MANWGDLLYDMAREITREVGRDAAKELGSIVKDGAAQVREVSTVLERVGEIMTSDPAMKCAHCGQDFDEGHQERCPKWPS